MDWLIGKAYRTRAGNRAVLLENDGTSTPLGFKHESGNVLWHYKDGACNVGKSDDIIAEWVDQIGG